MKVSITVDGTVREHDIEPRLLLVQYLRDVLGGGTNVGCDTSNCGACTVLLDGESVKSCTMLAVQASGHQVATIRSLGGGGTWHPLQDAFRADHGLQCGYCTPGMVMSAVDLLRRNPDPTPEEVRLGLAGNLCRCTGYQNIVKAVRGAAAAMREASAGEA
jgi:carbon-monoxide dehydrogenase small subunit